MLATELQNFRIKVTALLDHDDLVFAVGAGVWMAERVSAGNPGDYRTAGGLVMSFESNQWEYYARA